MNCGRRFIPILLNSELKMNYIKQNTPKLRGLIS